MFANRYTAFVDACSLVGVLKRNLLLTLAQAEFYRLRWSKEVLDETESALARIFAERGDPSPIKQAALQRARMEAAFEDAMVSDFDQFRRICENLPDPNDGHVLAAALKTQAATLVTDNLKHFPLAILGPLNLEVRSTDAFIADTIALDIGRGVASVQRMRQRFKKPEFTAERLITEMVAVGLTETVEILKPHILKL